MLLNLLRGFVGAVPLATNPVNGLNRNLGL